MGNSPVMETDMRLRFLALLIAFLLPAGVARADYCAHDKMVEVILVGDEIYFKTAKTCLQVWCRVDPAWSSQAKERVYSLMMTALASNNDVAFFWTQAPDQSCPALPNLSIPAQVIIQRP